MEEYNFGVDAAYVESMLGEFNMSALTRTPTLRWERRETNEKDILASEQGVYRQLVGKLLPLGPKILQNIIPDVGTIGAKRKLIKNYSMEN